MSVNKIWGAKQTALPERAGGAILAGMGAFDSVPGAQLASALAVRFPDAAMQGAQRIPLGALPGVPQHL